MGRITAITLATQMVDSETIRDRAYVLLVHPSVQKHSATVPLNLGIAIVIGTTAPDPAGALIAAVSLYMP
jgi:hypothetical protein